VTRADVAAPPRFDRRLIAPMILGSVLNPVNSSLIAVALVPIGVALGAPASHTAWLVSALYLAGAVLIGIGGLAGALAPSLTVLVVARVLIGLGTCAGYPSAMALIRREADRTGQQSPAGILTLLSISTQTIAVIGPTVGGFLLGIGGWRSTFLVNVPLALACLVLGAWRLPRSTAAPDGRSGVAGRIDVAGIALFTLTLVALLGFLTHPGPDVWYLPAIAVVAAVGFTVRELRAATPFLDLRVLGGNGPLLATYARALLSATVAYSVLYGYTQWLEQGRGLSPTTAGLVLLPIFATGVGVAALTGRNPRIRGKLLVGCVAQVVVAVLLLVLGPHSALWLVVVIALVAGIPQGVVNLANQNAVYHQADPQRLASSAGLLRTFFYLGAITSSTTAGLTFGPRADTAGLHVLALVMLVAAVLCLIVTLADRSLRRVA
jgi:MFS family permease